LSRHATMGLLGNCISMTGVPVVRKLLVAPESKMAHLMMVSMLMFTVQMRRQQVILGGDWARRLYIVIYPYTTLIVCPCLSKVVVPALIGWGRRTLLGRQCMFICVVEHHSIVHHSIAGLGGGDDVCLLVGSGMGSKTPAGGHSRESWLIHANREAEGGHA
jgi:hypothetical protein